MNLSSCNSPKCSNKILQIKVRTKEILCIDILDSGAEKGNNVVPLMTTITRRTEFPFGFFNIYIYIYRFNCEKCICMTGGREESG
jgi:hypothetical protein